jgi:hypothetical protein
MAARIALIALAAVLTLSLSATAQGATKEPPAPVDVADDALVRALYAGSLTEAQYALQRALSLFRLGEVRARFGDVARPDPRDATLILRDLAVRLDELADAERKRAGNLLARPDDGADPTEHNYSPDVVASGQYFSNCTDRFCLKWVGISADAPPLIDADADGLSDYVETAVAVIEEVWAREIGQLGFRAPKNDLNSPSPFNADGRIDIYLADVGSDGLFGYCATDDPNAPDPNYPFWDASAYCVLDNDFAPSQFPGTNSFDVLRVTAAHEFFHAIQFAYNAFLDPWLAESTAVWMEDEVYDDVNDNYNYLLTSALVFPGIPLDYTILDDSRPESGLRYGAWLFIRLLGETFGQAIVRRIVEIGDGSQRRRVPLSVVAVDLALRERRSSFARAFAAFGAANVWPPAFYDEGSDYLVQEDGQISQLSVPLPAPIVLSGRKRSVGPKTIRLDHLTNGYAWASPRAGVRPSARLQVIVDLPPRAIGSGGALVVERASGTFRVVRIPLSRGGDGRATVSFGRGQILSVKLVLTNGSTAFLNCNRGLPFTCQGTPADDDRTFRYTFRLLQ